MIGFMMQLNLPAYPFKLKTKEQKKYIFDAFRGKFVKLTPEEWVRQHFIRYLVEEKGYSPSLIAVEMPMRYNKLDFRADAVVHNRQAQPVLIIECKAPDIPVSQEHFDQIIRYNMQLKVEYLMVTNGLEHYCCRVDPEAGRYHFLKDIPSFSELTG
jgi:predicted type IV restriction endonuclease